MKKDIHPKYDVIITEIGGTVGDIESQPFLEAAREVRRDLGADNCMFVHVRTASSRSSTSRSRSCCRPTSCC